MTYGSHQKKHEDRLIKIFVELCNPLPTFNYKEGTQTVTFGEATEVASEGNGSDLDCFTAPENAVKSKDFMAFLFYEPWLHGFCTVGVIHVR